jgi:signal transduction histidine kinase
VPPDLRDRIFDPFFTTKATGTGLGLAIASRIITAHRGRLTLANPPTGGAVFTVTLPPPEAFGGTET